MTELGISSVLNELKMRSDLRAFENVRVFASTAEDRLGYPRHLIAAIILAEDKRFPVHRGFDLVAVMRAVEKNLGNGGLQGASTLTQQLFTIERIADLHLRSSRTLNYKLRQIRWALDRERASSKFEILSSYLSTVYFGKNYFGIRQASLGYFDLQPAELSPAHSLFLAERIASPNTVRPSRVKNILRRKAFIQFRSHYGTRMTDLCHLYTSAFAVEMKYTYGQDQFNGDQIKSNAKNDTGGKRINRPIHFIG